MPAQSVQTNVASKPVRGHAYVITKAAEKGLTSLDLFLGTLVDQAQLDESLQQQQTVMQQMLDVLNEKIENWVCQCFSDLRNRIIELVSSSRMLHNSCHETICASLVLS